MFQLLPKDIHLGVTASGKQDAIQQIAAALTAAGYVDATYVEGMLQRELQTSTYLGSGIAIPHGTTDTRDLVFHTGVQVFQFPDGVEWGEGQIAYVVIGIAARSDEHLALLRQLTHILSNEHVAEQLALLSSAEELCRLFNGEKQQTEFQFDASLIALDVEANDLMTLQALNAGRLKKIGAVNAQFVSGVIANAPLHLGHGIWLSDSVKGNEFSAATLSRVAHSFQEEGSPVSLLLTVSMTDEQPVMLLNRLSDLLLSNKAEQLLNADSVGLLTLLTCGIDEKSTSLNADYVVRNEHGLHARPGALLVNTIKKFSSDITVTNLDSRSKPVNGRSLMKVIALGVKKGHRLHFTACGEDAELALQEIGKAINDGLGEETA